LDSHFPHIYPRSIEVDKVKEVVVINNEFAINAIKVVSAKDGSLLYISCNRLLGSRHSYIWALQKANMYICKLKLISKIECCIEIHL
jgi:hypothetical protein